nr:hypothetical protein [uncultured Tessaracoccus sp.]
MPGIPLRLDGGVGCEHGRELPHGEEFDACRDALERGKLLAEQPGGTRRINHHQATRERRAQFVADGGG